MEVRLTEEQRLLVSAARSFAERFANTGGTAAPDAAGAWRAAARTGLPGLLVPEGSGGGGARALEAALVVEEVSRALVPVPLAGTLLAAGLAVAAGAEADARALASGSRPGCVVLDDELLAPAPEGVAWDHAPGALVLAVRDRRTVVEASAGRPLESVDLHRALARAAEGSRTLGVLSAEGLARWEALALSLVCADLVGTLSGALDAAVAHARVREQFGRPIGSFQAVQQLAAEQHVLVEGARSCTWHAAWAVDALAPDAAFEAASVAKAYCSEIARPVAEAALQIWGGLGMTWECVAHLYLRRALLDRRVLGDEEHHLTVLSARRLGPADEAPGRRSAAR